MKIFKSIFVAGTILVGGAFASSAQTPGQLIFQTFEPGDLSSHLILGTDGMTKAQGPNVVARVYTGATADFSAMTAQGPEAVAVLTGSGAGFIQATGQANGGLIDVSGTLPGDMVFYSIAAWDTTTGATFDSATVRGNSTPVGIALGGTPASGPAVTALNVNTFDTFQLQDVGMIPEPSTVALGIIGGLALLMRRRRS